MKALPRLMVAPTGARRGKADHPALPIILPEIIETARACRAAGADGLHLHLRDEDGRHLLDATRYAEAVAELACAVPDMAVQITTEAAGRYAPDHQRRVALGAGAGLVSASVRELATGTPDAALSHFYARCAARGIAVQHILYDIADLDLLHRVLPPELFGARNMQVIVVLGRYARGQNSNPADLLPFLDAFGRHEILPDWALCAFGQGETDCLIAAHHAGGKLRVGFENALLHADGRLARDNAERVAAIVDAIAAASG